MKVLLTGATGFIGQYVFKQAIERGFELLCTKRSSSDLSKLGSNATHCRWINTDHPEWIDGVEQFTPEIILHLAWGGVDAANRGNWSTQIENLSFQQQLLDIAVKVGVKKFITVGSQAEYGTFEGCVNENYPINPNSAYGATKVAAMTIVKSFCETNAVAWYWFRLFSCFGEGEADNWLIPSTIKNMLKGGSMDFTPGEQRYAYLYIGEVAAALLAATEKDAPSGVYNISADKTISIKELLTKIRDKVNPQFTLNFGALPYREGQTMLMQGDNNKLKQLLYAPDCNSFDDRLEQTIAYYSKKNEQ